MSKGLSGNSKNKEIKIEILLDNLTKEEAICKEIEYISKYNNLLNSTTGGEHCQITDEVKNKLSKIQKEKYVNGYINPMLGKKREDLSNINRNRGNEFYKELAKKNSDKFKISFNTTEHRKICVLAQKTRKEVNQFDMNGNFIKKWESIRRICDHFRSDVRGLRSVYKSISNCCKGKKKSAYKFRWEYV
jgi:hypothetical protein